MNKCKLKVTQRNLALRKCINTNTGNSIVHNQTMEISVLYIIYKVVPLPISYVFVFEKKSLLRYILVLQKYHTKIKSIYSWSKCMHKITLCNICI